LIYSSRQKELAPPQNEEQSARGEEDPEVYLIGEAMKNWLRSQEKSIRSELIGDAVAEQLKSQAADEGLENGKRGTIAIPQQIVGSRRRADDIIIDLLDEWSDPKVRIQKVKNHNAPYKSQPQSTAGISSRRKAHRGRRSQESLTKRANRK